MVNSSVTCTTITEGAGMAAVPAAELAADGAVTIGDVAGGLAIEETIQQNIPTHRQCTVYIANGCRDYTLCNPRVHMENGHCHIPLPPTIGPLKSGCAQFVKTFFATSGSVGVFTYDLLQNGSKKSTEKMAVMFSVPYSYIWFSNQYAVGVFDCSKKCDNNLFRKMYYKPDSMCVQGAPKDTPSITHRGDRVTVTATMSNSFQPTMKVEVRQN